MSEVRIVGQTPCSNGAAQVLASDDRVSNGIDDHQAICSVGNQMNAIAGGLDPGRIRADGNGHDCREGICIEHRHCPRAPASYIHLVSRRVVGDAPWLVGHDRAADDLEGHAIKLVDAIIVTTRNVDPVANAVNRYGLRITHTGVARRGRGRRRRPVSWCRGRGPRGCRGRRIGWGRSVGDGWRGRIGIGRRSSRCRSERRCSLQHDHGQVTANANRLDLISWAIASREGERTNKKITRSAGGLRPGHLGPAELSIDRTEHSVPIIVCLDRVSHLIVKGDEGVDVTFQIEGRYAVDLPREQSIYSIPVDITFEMERMLLRRFAGQEWLGDCMSVIRLIRISTADARGGCGGVFCLQDRCGRALGNPWPQQQLYGQQGRHDEGPQCDAHEGRSGALGFFGHHPLHDHFPTTRSNDTTS